MLNRATPAIIAVIILFVAFGVNIAVHSFFVETVLSQDLPSDMECVYNSTGDYWMCEE